MSKRGKPAKPKISPDSPLQEKQRIKVAVEQARYNPVEAKFPLAPEGAAILIFDEADNLFGKRTTVKDSHGKYSGS